MDVVAVICGHLNGMHAERERNMTLLDLDHVLETNQPRWVGVPVGPRTAGPTGNHMCARSVQDGRRE